LSVDAALASACLPTLQRAVVVDGEPYWDGGYSANPALSPLLRVGDGDLLLVALGPLAHHGVPVSVEEIRVRALEFSFHASFQREAELLAEACACARAGRWPGGRLERRLRRLRTHCIDGAPDLEHLSAETRLIAHRPFLERLRDRGRERAIEWLAACGDRVGSTSTAELV
jgi:NTE family protein